MVRLIEAANVLLEGSSGWPETLLLKVSRALYQRRLRRLIVAMPADMASEILVAGDRIGGKAPIMHDPMMN
jgi:hypothetical protein